MKFYVVCFERPSWIKIYLFLLTKQNYVNFLWFDGVKDNKSAIVLEILA